MMTIVYIILGLLAIGVVFALLKILLEFVAKVIGYIIGLCIVAGVVGLLTYWLLDSFWLGFVPAEIIVLYLYFKNRNAPQKNNSCTNYNNYNEDDAGTDEFLYFNPYSSIRSYSDTNYNQDIDNSREREFSDFERENYSNQGMYYLETEKIYRDYLYYREKAKKVTSLADTYWKNAEDKERQGCDSDYYDDDYELQKAKFEREVQLEKEKAEQYYSEAREYLNRAEYYYKKFTDAKN